MNLPNIPYYRILNILSTAGGMSKVYRGIDLRSKQEVAIKELDLKGSQNSYLAELFKKEANHYIYLDHPQLMKLIDFAEQGNGYYIIMELVKGMSLAECLHSKTGPMVAENAIPMFLHVLETIDYLHRKNILHLDIKPANIMVQDDGNIKVIDMGISTDLNNIDHFIKRVGTPAYMSPEQINGEKLGFYTDIYALGVTLFKMLTNFEPFGGESREELNYNIKNKPIPQASDFYPDISDEMQCILEKAMNKNPKERYLNCADFAEALNDILYT
jgi:serine/threonine-protein kinase